MKNTTLRLLKILLLFDVARVATFSAFFRHTSKGTPGSRPSRQRSFAHQFGVGRRSLCPASKLLDDDAASFTAGSFNPFNYDAAKSRSSSSFANNQNSNTKNVVSLRKTRMQQMTNAMLNAAPDNTQLLAILAANKDFLLEPLEDENAVQEADSIYLLCNARAERYRAFEQSMADRLAKAKDPAVRQVLTSIMDFVMHCENES
jgi:hypothetical protein